MTRTVFCKKLNKEAEGLDYAPLPGATGQKIYENISKEAWQMWIAHQTILINEHRLSLMDPEARKFLALELEKFLFGEGSALPEAYTAPIV